MKYIKSEESNKVLVPVSFLIPTTIEELRRNKYNDQDSIKDDEQYFIPLLGGGNCHVLPLDRLIVATIYSGTIYLLPLKNS